MISVLITNYNKDKFLKNCLNSLYKSTFKKFEVILFDDVSTDNSNIILRNFKKIKIIRNQKKKFNSPSLNQIYGVISCFKKSKGKILCLLDSDDFFKKDKLKIVENFFLENKKLNCFYNFPSADKSKFKFKEKKSKNIWPTIFPTSCISIRSKVFKKFILYVKPSSYENLEIDARLIIFMSVFFNEYNYVNKKLTKYNNDNFGLTSNIPKFSKKWWLRRMDAYEYMDYLLKKKNRKLYKTLDYLLTFIISKLYRFF